MAGTALDDGIPTIVAAEALGQLRANAVLPNHVRRDFENVVATFGQSVQVQKRGTLTASSVTHPQDLTGSGITPQVPADTNVSVTLNNHQTVDVGIESFYQSLNRPDQLAGHGEDAAIVLADEVDQSLFVEIRDNATTDVLTNGMTGASDGGDVLPSDIINARKILSQQRAPMRDRFAVWSPEAVEVLLQKAIFSGFQTGPANSIAQIPDEQVREGLVDGDMMLGRRYSFMHMEDQNASGQGSTASFQVNALFQRQGPVLVTRPLDPPPAGAGALSRVVSEAGLSLRVTMQWDQTFKITVLSVDLLWGTSLFRPEFCVHAATQL